MDFNTADAEVGTVKSDIQPDHSRRRKEPKTQPVRGRAEIDSKGHYHLRRFWRGALGFWS